MNLEACLLMAQGLADDDLLDQPPQKVNDRLYPRDCGYNLSPQRLNPPPGNDS
jgi:hypothetical protein